MTESRSTPQRLKLCLIYVKLNTHHQGRDDFISHFFDSDHISAGLRVDDALLFLPAHHYGFLPMSYAAHPFLLALRGQSGVWVGGDHGWDWIGSEIERKSMGIK